MYLCVHQNHRLAESMSGESMAEFFDAAEQFETSSDESEVCNCGE